MPTDGVAIPRIRGSGHAARESVPIRCIATPSVGLIRIVRRSAYWLPPMAALDHPCNPWTFVIWVQPNGWHQTSYIDSRRAARRLVHALRRATRGNRIGAPALPHVAIGGLDVA